MRRLVLIITLALSLFSQTADAQRIHAIVEDYLDEVNCISPQRLTWKEQYTVRLLDDNAASLASFSIGCDNTRRLSKFSMTISDGAGKIIRKVKKSDLSTTEYTPDMVVDGIGYFFEYNPSAYPVVVSVQMEVEVSGGFATFPTFQPQTSYQTLVTHAAYRLTTPAGMTPIYKTQNISAEVKTTPLPGGQTLTELEVDSLPTVISEAWSKPVNEVLPMAWFAPEEFSFFKTNGSNHSWQTFGKWQYGLLQGRDILPEEFTAKLQKLTADCTTDRQKVEQVYRLLRKTTRYVSIQLGLGGWQPSTAAYVYKTGIGDCKALTNYMKSMLAAVGIPSTYVIIHTKKRHLHRDFVSINQFNHVILQVKLHEGDTLWLECTNPALPLGYLHEDIAGHDCLLITEHGGELATVPEYPEDANITVNTAVVNLQKDGSADVSMTISQQGSEYEENFYMQFLEPKKQSERLAHLVDIPQARISDVRLTDTLTQDNMPVYRLTAKATSAAYARKTGSRLFLSLNPFHDNYAPLPKKDVRTTDIDMEQGYTVVDSVTISIPEGYRVEALPGNERIETACGAFETVVTATASTITAVTRLTIRKGTYSREGYPQLQSATERMARAYQGRAVLVEL